VMKQLKKIELDGICGSLSIALSINSSHTP
jgi:hypothetical protein